MPKPTLNRIAIVNSRGQTLRFAGTPAFAFGLAALAFGRSTGRKTVLLRWTDGAAAALVSEGTDLAEELRSRGSALGALAAQYLNG